MSRIAEMGVALLQDAPDVPIPARLHAATTVKQTRITSQHLANQGAKELVFRHARQVVPAHANTEANKSILQLQNL